MTASTESLFALSERYYLPVYRPRRIVLDHGQGARIWDRDGREYVDFGAGIAVNALGHAHPALIAALTEQAGKLWHTSNVFVSEPPLRLAEALVSASGFAERVFFCNSGAEANEAAIKLARKWATAQGREPERRAILSFRGSFHGRTLAAVTATAQPKYHEGFEPLPPGFRYSDFNDLAAAEAAMADGAVCAVLVEPVQGEGGVTPATAEFLSGLRALCDRHDALLILDEIQCGMGRTGRLFACHGYEVVPDVVTLAKALGSGFPIGAMLVGARAGQSMQFGAHGTTFGGNPLAAAVANAALRELSSPALLANVLRQSEALRAALAALDEEYSLFSEVRGRGLMLGAQLRPEHAGKAGEILDRCVDHGLLLLQAGPDVLRFVPALNISDADIGEGLARLRAALAAFLGR
ncbi:MULTISPECIES: acetylornithine/succinyldiaminopimelate transaminase [unclassified Lysobacter]|uniref:acetylornithine/succinyldiaminopimelate transaminase n=1 Tax=unclassified Lysobacter TaxID=2635362 RepID=UPI0006FF56BC|nr:MULTISPECIES: acetylornithine/succinyldiaminopimelate transaminase [unclassified Lysobacter]KRA16069.1 acetylornithine aminotransferase [Lysobacter sp. Root604]KRD31770.1 acetylornithine aminotransferase [Lysobacter sp. Root916]KRD75638.1 acetylornithine aminotransferase [Lysobacter sp. Root983]